MTDQDEPLPEGIRCQTPSKESSLELQADSRDKDHRPQQSTDHRQEEIYNSIEELPQANTNHSNVKESFSVRPLNTELDSPISVVENPPVAHDTSSASPNIEQHASNGSSWVFGVDTGRRDLDLLSDDASSLLSVNSYLSPPVPPRCHYYRQPVSVSFPASFFPLPPVLEDDSTNLVYFHFFIDRTARRLVAHDCSSNPFRTLLPHSKSINLFVHIPKLR